MPITGRRRTFVAAVLAGLLFAYVGCVRRVDQPVAYNHQVHVDGEEMECTECHSRAEAGFQATLPGLDVCEGCHVEAEGEGLEEAKVVKAVNTGTPIQWERVYSVPDHVFFSHRRHVQAGELSCAECHGEVRDRAHPFTVATPPLSMSRCVNCHRSNQVSTDCAACHR